MTQPPSGDDPLIHALDGLVRSGQLAPERARAALEAGRRDGASRPPAGPAVAPASGDTPGSAALRLDTAGVAIGTALVATTVVLTTAYARSDGDLDWSNYALTIIATVGLLGVAAAAMVLVKDPGRRLNLAAWSGALGAVGTGSVIGVAMDDSSATGYVAGLVVAGLSAAGYYFVRSGAFVVTAIVGLVSFYATLAEDILDPTGGDNDNIGMTLSAAILVFAVLVTIGGWLLPTRDLSGVFVGALTVVGFVAVLVGLVFATMIAQLTASMSSELAGAPSGPDPDRYNNDAYVILLFAALLVAGWAVCAWRTGHVGYRVLILALTTAVVPLVTAVLQAEHPSWWGLGVGVVGGGTLVVFVMRAMGMFADFGKRPPSRPSGGTPVNLDT